MTVDVSGLQDELLIIIRKTIALHRKGTWDTKTIVYNHLMVSGVRRTDDSLKNRYRIIRIQQGEQRIQTTENDVLTKAAHYIIR
jgi:hypothetical protein